MWRTFLKMQKRSICFDGGEDTANLPNGEGQQQTSQTPAPATETVVLTKKEYADMTSALASMKTALEALVEEPTNRQQQQQEPQYAQTDIDVMTNTQLLRLVGDHINKVVTESRQPLIDALATIAVKEELREVKEEFKDFDTYSSDIQTMAKSNPQLSLKQCYILVKAGKPAPSQPETQTQKIVPTPAARGGIVSSAVTNQKGMSVREAAQAALNSIKYE